MAKILEVSEENFDSEVLQSDLPVLVDFYADWCGPCKVMAPHLEKASEEIKSVKFGKVDVDKEGDLAGKFGVLSIPTTISFKDGEQVDRHTGALSVADIKKIVEKSF